MLLLFFILFAYLIGSLSCAIIFCKLLNLPDPRTQGSGNPGATNVLRFGGRKLAIVVLLGDILKGAIPVILAKLAGLSDELLGWVALAAFIGHLFPIFFRLQGGKGVATALGGLLALAWPLAILVIVTWLIVALIFRYSSLASITAAALLSLYAYWLAPRGTYLAILTMCILLIARHYQNIQRLIAGKEGKIGKKK